MTSSLAQLSAEFSVLLAAITHFTLAFFQHNKHSQRVTFAGQFLVWLGKFPLGSKLISGGVAITMSWCAFFEKINSRGGTSIPDWRVTDEFLDLKLIKSDPKFVSFMSGTQCNSHNLISNVGRIPVKYL